jgi:hypothetical protein
VPAEILAANGFKLDKHSTDASLKVTCRPTTGRSSTCQGACIGLVPRAHRLVLLVGVALTANFIRERPRSSELSFLLLGAGFMLVETKAITELGLTFGSTWRVTAVVIAGVLFMAFLANLLVERFRIHRPQVAFVLLMASLAAGWLMAGKGGFGSTAVGRLATVALLTSPMFFSGIVFSTLLRGRQAIAAVMAANLSGGDVRRAARVQLDVLRLPLHVPDGARLLRPGVRALGYR